MDKTLRGNGVARAAPAVFDGDPAAVRRWVEELPLANLSEVAHRLVRALQNAQGESLSHFLEAIGPAALLVLEHLKGRYAHQPLPLDRSGGAAGGLAIELTAGLMRGYTTLLRQGRSPSPWPWHRWRAARRRAVALHRIFFFGEHFIAIHRLLHVDLPAGVWLRLNRCYALAERERLCGIRARRPGEKQRNTSVGDQYRRLLLASLLPPRLPVAQQRAIAGRLDAWVGLTALRRSSVPLETAHHAVQLGSDRGAVRIAHLATDPRSWRGTRVVDVGALVRRLAEVDASGVEEATLAVVRDAWCSAAVRIEERNVVQGRAEIAVGFGAVFGCVGGIREETRSLFFGGGAVGRVTESAQAESPWPASAPLTLLGRIIDRSDNGLAIDIPLGDLTRVAGGMPVAVRVRGEGWRLGAVVRLARRGAVMRLGVKLLLQGVVPARLRGTEAASAGAVLEVVAGRRPEGAWAMAMPALSSWRSGMPMLEVGGRRQSLKPAATLFHSAYMEVIAISSTDERPLVLDAAGVAGGGAARGAVAAARNAPSSAVGDRERRVRQLMEQTGLGREDAEYVADLERAAG